MNTTQLWQCNCFQAHEDLRGAPYLLSLDEVARRTAEAWDRGATEVCMQVTTDGFSGMRTAACSGAPELACSTD